MPGDFGQIEILDMLTVDVNFEIVCQPGNPLDDAPLGAVAFVKKRRYHRHTRLLRMDGHCYTVTCIISHQRASTKTVHSRDHPTAAGLSRYRIQSF